MSDADLELLRNTINRWTKSINGMAATGNFMTHIRDTPANHLQAMADLVGVCDVSSCDATVIKNVAYYCLSTASSCSNFSFPPPYSKADDIADADSAVGSPAATSAAWSCYDRDMTEEEKVNLAQDMRAAIDSLRQRFYDIRAEIRARHNAAHDKSDILRMGYGAVLAIANIVYDPQM
jgi:hypothetical protein